MKHALLLFLICLLGTSAMYAQTSTEANRQCVQGMLSINQTNAKAYMNVLASDSLQGRCAGTVYGRKAADYIVQQLRQTGIAPLGKSYYQPFSQTIRHLKRVGNGATLEYNPADLCNILGVIKGYDTSNYVIIGAHYDHLAARMSPQNNTDSIYNGADDNASGVTGVLQIAKAFVASGNTPPVNIVFAFWDAEESGLVGSTYFTDSCAFLKQVRGYVNLDMIGRNTRPNGNRYFVSYFYSDMATINWLKEDIEHYALPLAPRYQDIEKAPGGSDHLPFAKKGVPFIFYNTGMHNDLHQVSDEVNKIDWNVMENVTKAAYLSVWHWVYGDDLPTNILIN